jgi:hypothetical protein
MMYMTCGAAEFLAAVVLEWFAEGCAVGVVAAPAGSDVVPASSAASPAARPRAVDRCLNLAPVLT